jgi:hypothetical protein
MNFGSLHYFPLFKIIRKDFKRNSYIVGPNPARGRRPIGRGGLLGPFGHRGGAEPAMAEIAQAVVACPRRRCCRGGIAPRPETEGGGRGEALSGSPGGRREEQRWRVLGIGVVGSGLGK